MAFKEINFIDYMLKESLLYLCTAITFSEIEHIIDSKTSSEVFCFTFLGKHMTNVI